MRLKLFVSVITLFLSFQVNLLAGENHQKTTREAFTDYYKKLQYEVSLAYTKYSAGDRWWNKIEPLNLYLGALPLENKGHLEAIQELGVTHVLSMVEDFEIEDGWFNIPVKQESWRAHGIEVKHIQAVDCYPLQHDHLEEGIEYLAKVLEAGNTVYVHCKAGRGRSASIVIGYLMRYHKLSFKESFELVKQQRPQINLNHQQSETLIRFFREEALVDDLVAEATFSGGIYNLFSNMNDLSEEGLAKLLDALLYYVIEGVNYHSGEMAPAALATWMPSIEIDSTLTRRDRYLKEFDADREAAVEAAISRNHGLNRKLKTQASKLIPFVGTPTSFSVALWHQLREIALIAALHGHDIYDPEVRMKIYSCLLRGDGFKVPAYSVKYIARQLVKQMLPRAATGVVSVAVIPAGVLFDYFTDNAAHVAAHAKEVFGGENTIVMP